MYVCLSYLTSKVIYWKLLWHFNTSADTSLTTTAYTVSQKNDTDVAHYNFNAHQPILVIFGRDVAERVCYQTVICYLTSPN